MADSTSNAASAQFDFRRARRRAALKSVMAQLRGEDARLLSYEVVRRKLRAVESSERRLADVPLRAIVGSVGRYQDFTREFLPLVEEDSERWIGVRLAMTGLEGVPPVELYRLGDAYFVKDGNHRVSVARQLGAKSINAYVTQVHSRVPLDPSVDYEALILATEYAEFLEATGIDQLRPEADLRVTEAGQYPLLIEHIQVHQYYMGMARDQPVAWDEAVTHWYDEIYLPVATAILQHDLMTRFPGRTETDLYLFLSKHRGQLEREFGWSLEGVQLAEGLSAENGFDLATNKARLQAAVDTRVPLRAAMAALVDAILVVTEAAAESDATAYAATLAAAEDASVLGLRLGAPATEDEAVAAKERFRATCEKHGVRGQLAYAEGNKVNAVLTRAAYVDMVVVAAPYPEGLRRQSWLRSLIYRSRKPLLAVRLAAATGSWGSAAATRLHSRPLLAYDGGERAEAALFWLAYECLARGLSPTVVTVGEGDAGSQVLDKAGAFLLSLGLEPELILERGAVAATILQTAERTAADLILLGSYKYNRWLEQVTGGVLDEVIRGTKVSVLVT